MWPSPKVGFLTVEDAIRQRNKMNTRDPLAQFDWFHCKACGKWHVGRPTEKDIRRERYAG